MLRFAASRVTGRAASTMVLAATVGASSTFIYHKNKNVESSENGYLLETLRHSIMTNKSVCYAEQEKSIETSDILVSNLSMPSSELILPTLEATQRAGRLVCTLVAITAEYRVKPHLPERFLRYLHQDEEETSVANEDDEEIQQTRFFWQNQVQLFTQELDESQEKYTSPVPNVDTTQGLVQGYKEKITQQRKQAVHDAAEKLSNAEKQLAKCGGDELMKTTHLRSAKLLLDLCHRNGGVYIKIGQHLANLDYILPHQYITTLSHLFQNAPVTSYEKVHQVIQQELGYAPDELFDQFSKEPIASASLAQVHTAYCKRTKQKLAIKVQHAGLRETSQGDILALTLAVRAMEYLFPESFNYGWIVDEIAPNLPKELDFVREGKNSEKACAALRKVGITEDHCIIPKVRWEQTSHRVLAMEFEEGFPSTDVEKMKKHGLSTRDVAKAISSVFNSQVFTSGFVHCDPHPANVLVRCHPKKNAKPQLVLVDHGLYKQIDDEFRVTYAQLWKALLLADIPQIKISCGKLGVKEMYTLLAAMLTARPFDEIIERSKNNGSLHGSSSSNTRKAGDDGDKAMIRGYAQRYLTEILAMLDTVPRQMLLLFKMNDCLRHVDYALQSPNNSSLAVAGKYAAKAVLEEDLKNIAIPRNATGRKNAKNNFESSEKSGRLRHLELFNNITTCLKPVISVFLVWMSTLPDSYHLYSHGHLQGSDRDS
eukprot:scaffold121352_cov53-Attheya_sp.AAC.5